MPAMMQKAPASPTNGSSAKTAAKAQEDKDEDQQDADDGCNGDGSKNSYGFFHGGELHVFPLHLDVVLERLNQLADGFYVLVVGKHALCLSITITLLLSCYFRNARLVMTAVASITRREC